MGSAERQGNLWGTAVSDWAETNERFAVPYWRAMLDDLEIGEGTVVLDAGCGSGGGSKLALERGAKVYGLDASKGMVEYARNACPAGDFRVGDLEALPFDDEFFGAVLAANSIQYAENPGNALREIRRVCRPGGRVSVCTWDVREKNEYRFLQAALAALQSEPPKTSGGPYVLAEPGKLEAFVESAGFKIVSGKSVPTIYFFENLDVLIRAQMCTGNAQILIENVGEEKFKEALAEFFKEYEGDDGQIRFNNSFRFVTAVPA